MPSERGGEPAGIAGDRGPERGERLGLTLTNLESGCVVRQQFTNVGASRHAAVKEAVEALVQALAGELQSPTGGAVKAKPAR